MISLINSNFLQRKPLFLQYSFLLSLYQVVPRRSSASLRAATPVSSLLVLSQFLSASGYNQYTSTNFHISFTETQSIIEIIAQYYRLRDTLQQKPVFKHRNHISTFFNSDSRFGFLMIDYLWSNFIKVRLNVFLTRHKQTNKLI